MRDGARRFLIGILLASVRALAVRHSPIVLSTVKGSPWLIYALVMLAYVSIASSWLGFERARAISSGSSKYNVIVHVDGHAAECSESDWVAWLQLRTLGSGEEDCCACACE